MTAPQNGTMHSPYRSYITREPFLFFEMRTTAKLLTEGKSDDDAISQIVHDNLFQYPTEKSVKRMAKACISRLHNMQDESLICAIAQQPQDVAKQICLYALMKDHRLILDFMVTVIGEKYRQRDLSFSRMDLNVFFLQLQEQDDAVAGWSESTITKIKAIMMRTLIENEYIDNSGAEHLNPVMIMSVLENAMRLNGDEVMLPAFNCFD